MKWTAWIGLAVLTVVCAMPAGAQGFLGDEFRMSADNDIRLRTPAVGFFGTGEMVAVWEHVTDGLVSRTFDADGNAQGSDLLLVAHDVIGEPPFRGDVATRLDPALVTTGDGGFLLFWTEEVNDVSRDFFFKSEDLLSREIHVQRFELGGTPVGQPAALSSAPGLDARPAAALLADGSVVVVWERRDGLAREVIARRVDAAGQPLGPQFLVGTGQRADVAALPGGGFLTAWDGCCDAGSDLGVFTRRYDAQGNALGVAQGVNVTTAGNQAAAQVAVAANGQALVTWQAHVLDEEDDVRRVQVFTRPMTPAGNLTGIERILTTDVFGDDHSSPTVVAVDGQGFLVTWMAWKDDFRYGVLGSRVNAAGLGADAFQISQRRINGQFRLALASRDGRALVAWEGFDETGSSGITGRLVGAPGPALGACAGLEGDLPFDLLASHSICTR